MNKIKQFIKRVENYIRNKVHNPLSTMSNLTYVLMGLLSLSTNFWLGLLLVLLGVASSGFHWTRTKCWHRLDIIAIMYVFATIGAWHWVGDIGVLFGLIIGRFCHYLFDNVDISSRTVIGVLGVFTLIPYSFTHSISEIGFVLMWFALAGGVSGIANHFEPSEDGIVYDTFHGIWHIFSGIGIYYLII